MLGPGEVRTYADAHWKEARRWRGIKQEKPRRFSGGIVFITCTWAKDGNSGEGGILKVQIAVFSSNTFSPIWDWIYSFNGTIWEVAISNSNH